MLGVHLLTLAYVAISFSIAKGIVLATYIVAVLGYLALTLSARLLRPVWLRLGCHLGAVGLAAAVVPTYPMAAMLLPFHAATLIKTESLISYVGSVLFVAVVIGLLSLSGSADASLRVAAGIWSLGVFLMHMQLSRHRSRIDSLEDDLRAAEVENARLGRDLRVRERTQVTDELLTRLEERHLMATKLHDQLGHMVTGSLFQLEAARLLLAEDSEQASSMISRAETVLKEGMESIRGSLHRIDPESGEIGVRRLEREVFDFDGRTGIRASLDVHGETSIIGPRIWQSIHETVTEALTNCAKHSGATRVDVSISVYPGVIRLQIRDNGKPHNAPVHYGMGIRMIDERTAATGGLMTVDATDGFSIVCLWRRR